MDAHVRVTVLHSVFSSSLPSVKDSDAIKLQWCDVCVCVACEVHLKCQQVRARRKCSPCKHSNALVINSCRQGAQLWEAMAAMHAGREHSCGNEWRQCQHAVSTVAWLRQRNRGRLQGLQQDGTRTNSGACQRCGDWSFGQPVTTSPDQEPAGCAQNKWRWLSTPETVLTACNCHP